MPIDDLRGVFLFAGLSDEQFRDLIAAGDEVRFESGDVLFRSGGQGSDRPARRRDNPSRPAADREGVPDGQPAGAPQLARCLVNAHDRR